MPLFNGEKYLKQAIESILRQTYINFEFIIIDDASTDTSLEILEQYNDPRIRLVKNDNNEGITKSLNRGLTIANGEYIARMDADDISLPNRFLEEVIFLDNNPDIVMVGTARELIDEYGVRIRDVIPKKDPNFQDICNLNPFQHSSIMIRKSILLEFGGYNELFLSAEDCALWLRIVKKYKVSNIQKILCKLRIHNESITVKKFEQQALYNILAIRIATNQITDIDIKSIHQFGINYLKDKLCRKEKIYLLHNLAEFHRKNDNFKEAQKIYLQIFFMDPTDIFSLVNYCRLFLGKMFISETTKLYYSLKRI